jgi:Aldehyde dehydrogenase family
MTVAAQPTPARGPAAAPSATSRADIDAAVAAVAAASGSWWSLALEERVSLLDELIRDYLAVAPRWVAAANRAEGIAADGPFGGEEWIAGPYFVVRNLRLLREALVGIAAAGSPEIPGPLTTRADGQVVAEVFPTSLYDRLFYPGVVGEVWMEPGVTLDGLAATQAVAYRAAVRPRDGGRVALVLGAGNVSSIGPMDALYKLFVERTAVVFKAHPVNAYLGPLLEEAFSALGSRGWFRVVYGGADEGAYLCAHPRIDEIHVTGSDRTYEAIVFGTGDEGRRRKAEGRPSLAKPVTAELGNVSPVIVVPGPWSAGDFAYQAENIASMLTNNAGFNCNAARVIVQHAGWYRRERLLDTLRGVFSRVPARRAYYPGAEDRWTAFQTAHPETETFGPRTRDTLPWALVAGVDPEGADEICFTTEAFTSVFAETALEAPTVAEFVDRAVEFVNERLWGTLNCTLIVHPASLRDQATADAVERAVANLRYGTVSINHWAAVGYGLVSLPWGAFPGHIATDIQSGIGWVHNTPMFSRAQKSVVRSPFRAFPKPPWFVTHRTAPALAAALTRFEADPSPVKLTEIFWLALRG